MHVILKYLPALNSLDADCGIQVHGCLNQIYEDVRKLCDEHGWDTVDAVIMGGDFQVRFILTSQLREVCMS